MADKKISELSAAGALDGTEVLPLVQGGSTLKTTVADVAPVRSVNDQTGAVEVSDAVVALGSVSTNAAIPLDAAAVYTLTLADDVTLSVSDAPTTRSRVVQVLVTASGARTLDFESGWLWAGAKPTALAASAQGLLSLSTMGAAVIASWQDLGDGS